MLGPGKERNADSMCQLLFDVRPRFAKDVGHVEDGRIAVFQRAFRDVALISEPPTTHRRYVMSCLLTMGCRDVC